MELDNNAHAVFLLHYHLVLVVKYRRKVFDNEVSTRAKEIFEHIAPKYNVDLQEWKYDDINHKTYWRPFSTLYEFKHEWEEIKKADK